MKHPIMYHIPGKRKKVSSFLGRGQGHNCADEYLLVLPVKEMGPQNGMKTGRSSRHFGSDPVDHHGGWCNVFSLLLLLIYFLLCLGNDFRLFNPLRSIPSLRLCIIVSPDLLDSNESSSEVLCLGGNLSTGMQKGEHETTK